MEDVSSTSGFSSCASPTSDTNSGLSQSSRRNSIFFPNRSPSASPPPPPRQPEKPFSLQNRRLQLRNAGFRGALLPTRRISPQLAAWRAASTESHPDTNKENCCAENSSQTFSVGVGGVGSSQRRRSSILQEISNSTQRRYHPSPRPSVTTLFEAQSPGTSLDESFTLLPKSPKYLDPPLELGSTTVEDPSLTMRSTDSSHSWSSPVGFLGKSSKRQEECRRMPSRDASRYIEHLERQLAAFYSRADTMDASMSNVQISKLKSLNSEQKILKRELGEWQDKFEDRVKAEVNLIFERELQLRSKVQALQKELELKDNRIREQEWEIEMATQKARNIEAVNSTNRSLERRVDVLTELLAQSPKKSETESISNRTPDGNSPAGDAAYRTPRPKSMFSKLPLSPVRRSLIVPPLRIPETGPSMETQLSEDDPELSPEDGTAIDDAKQQLPTSELVSIDSGLGDSCSPPSTRAPESQRSSMVSHISSASCSWGTSVPLSPELKTRNMNKNRRMRRFPSGSISLKPLVLSATTGALPSQARQSMQYQFPAFPAESAVPLHPNSSHEDALLALEGKSYQYQSFEEAIRGHGKIMDRATPEYDGDILDSGSPEVDTSSPYQSFAYDVEPQLEPSKRQQYPRELNELYELSPTVAMNSIRRRRVAVDRDFTPRAKLDFGKGDPGREESAMPLVAGSRQYLGFFQNTLSSYFALVRRIIANSWYGNWKKLGKLSWWVIRLFLGSQARSEWTRNQSRVAYLKTYRGGDTRAVRVNTNADNGTVESDSRMPPDPFSDNRLVPSQPKMHDLLDSISGHAHPINRTISAWAKFSVAVLFAFGFAVRDGPGSLMSECPQKGCCLHNSPGPHGVTAFPCFNVPDCASYHDPIIPAEQHTQDTDDKEHVTPLSTPADATND